MSQLPQIFAHRGAKSVAPENTLPAFEAALAMGVDGIELDVHRAKDGELVVIHDFDVKGTTDGSGAVTSFSSSELAKLDAGCHFGREFAGIGVPTLTQVLDVIGSQCLINVEIKSMDIIQGGDEVEPLLAIIKQRKLYDQVLISSFNPVVLIKLRWLDERVQLGVLHGSDMPIFLRQAWSSTIVLPQAFHPHHTAIDRDYMDWAHAKGFVVNTWTVNDADEAQRLSTLGVHTLISDVPDQLMATLRS